MRHFSETRFVTVFSHSLSLSLKDTGNCWNFHPSDGQGNPNTKHTWPAWWYKARETSSLYRTNVKHSSVTEYIWPDLRQFHPVFESVKILRSQCFSSSLRNLSFRSALWKKAIEYLLYDYTINVYLLSYINYASLSTC